MSKLPSWCARPTNTPWRPPPRAMRTPGSRRSPPWTTAHASAASRPLTACSARLRPARGARSRTRRAPSRMAPWSRSPRWRGPDNVAAPPPGHEPTMAHWLFKTEPSDYSFAHLVRDRHVVWEGVSAPAALIHLRAVKKGDLVVVYHTGDEKAAVGLAEVTRGSYEDP